MISGNRPAPKDYTSYADDILFDYQRMDNFPNETIWRKVGLISLNFKKYSAWNGMGRLTKGDRALIKDLIMKAHEQQKPFRFWGSPDSKTAWKAFKELGVDYINTDSPAACADYLNSLEVRLYENKETTKVYVPNYEIDQKNLPVKNIILLIGDGNGLSQLSAALLANGGTLSLSQLKSIGLIKTQSADDFTTDSAAAATALATGEKTNNRALGVAPNGKALVNLPELLDGRGFHSGLLTTDKITGATPAAFYAHISERDEEETILSQLQQSPLVLIAGGGASYAEDKTPFGPFQRLDTMAHLATTKTAKAVYFLSEHDVPSVHSGRGNALAVLTKNSLSFLAAKEKPFFLMVEAAQIDSYGHRNDIGGIVSEGLDFDRAISEAIRFADASENTLVIVTADHETSGLSLPQGNLAKKTIEGDFTTFDHTGSLVPLFAYGPKSGVFQGVYDNTEVFHKILQVLGIAP